MVHLVVNFRLLLGVLERSFLGYYILRWSRNSLRRRRWFGGELVSGGCKGELILAPQQRCDNNRKSLKSRKFCSSLSLFLAARLSPSLSAKRNYDLQLLWIAPFSHIVYYLHLFVSAAYFSCTKVLILVADRNNNLRDNFTNNWSILYFNDPSVRCVREAGRVQQWGVAAQWIKNFSII